MVFILAGVSNAEQGESKDVVEVWVVVPWDLISWVVVDVKKNLGEAYHMMALVPSALPPPLRDTLALRLVALSMR